MKSKKIAVIGSGFSGLAVCWHLLNAPSPPEVTLFSKGDEASRVSAGILHKYMGLYAKLNPHAIEAEKETQNLIAIAEQHAKQPLVISKGIVRLSHTEKQKAYYAICADSHPDVDWLDNCQIHDPNIASGSGIFIRSGLTIDTNTYLDALEKACTSKGLTVKFQNITDINELNDFDHIIGAMGSYTSNLIPFENIPLHPLKGQLLEIDWPKNLPPLPHTLISKVYLAMSQDQSKAVIGATFEHQFKDALPDSDFAIHALLPKALELYPKLDGCKITAVRAGIRATTSTRMPIAKILSKRYSTLSGLGSSGLLYHAYFAKQLVTALNNTL